MPVTDPHRTPQELAHLGKAAFDRHVRPTLGPNDEGRFVAIDIDTGDHEIDDDDYAAVSRLRDRRPSAELWLERVGQPAAYQMRRNE